MIIKLNNKNEYFFSNKDIVLGLTYSYLITTKERLSSDAKVAFKWEKEITLFGLNILSLNIFGSEDNGIGLPINKITVKEMNIDGFVKDHCLKTNQDIKPKRWVQFTDLC